MGFLVTRRGAAAWQLAAGHFQYSGRALEIEYPQPDASTQAYAYHRRFPTGYTRVIPVVPAWGYPPYNFTLSGTPPAGSTINNDPTSAGYGDITVPSGSTGSGTFTVRVQDQSGGDVTRSWAWERLSLDDTTYFVHLSDVAGGTESGTSTNPKHDVGQILGPLEGTNTWAGRQVIVRGTHVLSGLATAYDDNGSKLLMNANKPQVWVADPVNGATFRGSSDNVNGAHFNFEGGTDVAFVGITWNNPHVNQTPDTTQERNCFIDCSSLYLKFGLIYGNTFNCASTPGDSGSNSAVLFMGNNPSYSGNVTIAMNRFLNCRYLGPFTIYDTHDMAVVRNEYTDSEVGTDGFFWKGGDAIENVWVAFNYGTGNAGGIIKIEGIDFNPPTPYERGPFAIMHNRFVTTGLGIWLQAAADFVFLVTSKRNNWKIANHYFANSNLLDSASTGLWDYDAIEHNGTYTQGVRTSGAGATVTTTNNSHGTSGILNDTTGAQDAPDGTKGAEIL